MGIIIGKFRKKKTTLEVLEKLEKEIKAIEEFKRNTELTHKKIAGRFIVFSFGIYLIVVIVFCYYFLPSTISESVKYIGVLSCIPFLLIFVRKILGWYYNRKLSKNQLKLKSLKEEKKQLLDKVMDTETYKVAKAILEKFAPEQIRKSGFSVSAGNELTPVKSLTTKPVPSGLRLRNPQTSQPSPYSMYRGALPSTPHNTPTLPSIQTSISHSSALLPTATTALSSITPVSLPRAILPRNRSVLDKMVEFLIGDGPSNRYALICKNCDGHNGMALKEEFEYLSFRCCYCYTLNPAPKKRLTAPKLSESSDAVTSAVKNTSDTSDSERISASETESEAESEEKVTTIYNAEDAKLPENGKTLYDTEIRDVPMDVDSSENIESNNLESEEEVGSSKSSMEEKLKDKPAEEQEKEKEH